MRSNCLLWALTLHRRRAARWREGYLMVRWSRWGPFPHVLYAEIRRTGTVRVVSYKQISPRAKPVPPCLFRGSSRWGDFPHTEAV